jgi:hypothetical protein
MYKPIPVCDVTYNSIPITATEVLPLYQREILVGTIQEGNKKEGTRLSVMERNSPPALFLIVMMLAPPAS